VSGRLDPANALLDTAIFYMLASLVFCQLCAGVLATQAPRSRIQIPPTTAIKNDTHEPHVHILTRGCYLSHLPAYQFFPTTRHTKSRERAVFSIVNGLGRGVGSAVHGHDGGDRKLVCVYSSFRPTKRQRDALKTHTHTHKKKRSNLDGVQS
jgi:hypothetical protein